MDYRTEETILDLRPHVMRSRLCFVLEEPPLKKS